MKMSSQRDELSRFLKKHGEGVKMEEETSAHESGETPEEEVEGHKTASEEADKYIDDLRKKK